MEGGLFPSEKFVKIYTNTEDVDDLAGISITRGPSGDSFGGDFVPTQTYKLGDDIEIWPGDPNEFAPVPGWNAQ
jgi:hypothetical protein